MLNLSPEIGKFLFSPRLLFRDVWYYDYQDFRLILEQSEELHYFHFPAKAQRFLVRGLLIAFIGLILIISGLVLYSTISAWRYNVLEISNLETEKKRQEALLAIAKLSDKNVANLGNNSHDELLKIVEDYRERMNKMQILVNFSSQELKSATHALEEGLKVSGLNSGIVQRLKAKVASAKTSIGGNSEEITLTEANHELLEDYKINLAQLEQLKRIYQSLPTKTPTSKAITTSKYGVRVHPITNKLTLHEGLDFIPTIDQSARAVIPGIVEKVEHSSTGYGNMVVLLHPDNVRTIYAHLENIQVVPGQQVVEDQVLGIIGNSGFSTGKHLHYEISIDNVKVNPLIITALAKNVQ